MTTPIDQYQDVIRSLKQNFTYIRIFKVEELKFQQAKVSAR